METIDDARTRVRNAQKNYSENIKRIEEILIEERGYASRIPVSGENAVVLYSGGLDSSIMINKIIEEWDIQIYPLFIRRGARAEGWEEKAFDFFVDFYSKRFPSNMKEPFKMEFEIPPQNLKKNFPPSLRLTQGHPLRNSTMQNLAVMYAVSLLSKNREVRTIFSGSVADDYSEPELGLLSLRAQTLNTCINLADWRWQISSPMTDPCLAVNRKAPVSKAELIQYAISKFIPLEKTRSCFSSEEEADGECIACRKRLFAFKEAGYEDLVKYKNKFEEDKNKK